MKKTGNHTFDLYGSGGSLVDTCTQEILLSTPVADRARAIEPTKEYFDFIDSLLALHGKYGDYKKVLVSAAKIQDLLSQTDIRMLQLVKTMGESNAIDQSKVWAVFEHFESKILVGEIF